jgi:hypothetical protein
MRMGIVLCQSTVIGQMHVEKAFALQAINTRRMP